MRERRRRRPRKSLFLGTITMKTSSIMSFIIISGALASPLTAITIIVRAKTRREEGEFRMNNRIKTS